MNFKMDVKIENNEEILKNLDILKVILMIIVVIGHSMDYFNDKEWFVRPPSIPSNFFSNLAFFLNSFHIYTFTIISGYIFYYLKCENNNYYNFLIFLKKKIKRLIVPYCCVSIIWIIPFYIIVFKYDLVKIFRKFILAEGPAQLWFIIMLFDVFIIFWILSEYILENDVKKGHIIIICIYLFGLFGTKLMNNYFQIITACRYCLFFWIGYLIRCYGFDKLKKIIKFPYIILYLTIFILIMVLRNTSLYNKYILFVLTQLFIILNSVFMFFILTRLINYINKKYNYIFKSKIYRCLKKYNFQIYLFHQQIIVISLMFFDGKLRPLNLVIVNFILAMAGSLIIIKMMEITKIQRKMIGLN